MLYTDTDKTLHENDNRSCTVRALAMTCGVSYSEAYHVLKDLGRKHGRGFEIDYHIVEATDRLGYRSINMNNELQRGNQIKGSRITVKTIHRLSWIVDGAYYVVTRGHVLPVIDGEVLDHYKGKQAPILNIYKIEQKDKSVFELPALGDRDGLGIQAIIGKDDHGLYWRLEIWQPISGKSDLLLYYVSLPNEPSREEVLNHWRSYNHLTKTKGE